MYFETLNKEECRGCRACETKCPVNAITMKMLQGFYYPVIDESKCIKCNKCKQVCSATASITEQTANISKCLYGWHLDKDQRHESTSGGAFPAIAQSWMELHPGAMVYGAVYDTENHVIHKGTKDASGIKGMCRSKYVQSEMRSVYLEIQEEINNNGYVLFSGTPCQVAALKAVIGKETDHLLTVEFVCHGVMSPLLMEKYLAQLGGERRSRVVSYSFRNKRVNLIRKSIRTIRVEYSDGYVKETENDLLVMAYKYRLFYRPSCFVCPYASVVRYGDFTLGDFWGIENHLPSIKNERIDGISMVTFNTEHALAVESVLCKYMNLDAPPTGINIHGQMSKPTRYPETAVDYNLLDTELDALQLIKSYIPIRKRFSYLHPRITRIIHRLF